MPRAAGAALKSPNVVVLATTESLAEAGTARLGIFDGKVVREITGICRG
jgi:hypothetical protein